MPAQVHYDYPVLTTKQAAILTVLAGAIMPAADIAKATESNLQNLATALKTLTVDGLVDTELSATNRAVYSLSDAGRRALAAHNAALKAWNR